MERDVTTKHTLGPWVLDGHNLSTVLHCVTPRGPEAKHTCGDYEEIADCKGENWKANARLIAAAPDLLAALCALVLNIDAGGATLNAMKDAREAIAKAENRS